MYYNAPYSLAPLPDEYGRYGGSLATSPTCIRNRTIRVEEYSPLIQNCADDALYFYLTFAIALI